MSEKHKGRKPLIPGEIRFPVSVSLSRANTIFIRNFDRKNFSNAIALVIAELKQHRAIQAAERDLQEGSKP